MAGSPAPGTVLLITHERKDTNHEEDHHRRHRRHRQHRRCRHRGLALPIASAVTGDDEPVKRDEDAPEVALVDEDDRDDDSADPASRVTRDHSRSPRTQAGQTRDATAATGDVSSGGEGSRDDVSAATGD